MLGACILSYLGSLCRILCWQFALHSLPACLAHPANAHCSHFLWLTIEPVTEAARAASFTQSTQAITITKATQIANP